MSWKCKACDWTGEGDNLAGPIMHETMTGHETEPDTSTTKAWSEVL